MANIIIVEDEAIVAMENKMILRANGHDVIAVFSSAEDVLAGIESSIPDLFIMDIKLKGAMDGIVAVEEIRKKSEVPVIFLTGSSDIRTRERLDAISGIAVLHKPVLREELCKVVTKMLAAKK